MRWRLGKDATPTGTTGGGVYFPEKSRGFFGYPVFLTHSQVPVKQARL